MCVHRACCLSLLAVGIVGTEEEARKTGKQLILLYFRFLGFRTPIFDNRILRENPSWSTTRGENVSIREITDVREVVRFHKFISNDLTGFSQLPLFSYHRYLIDKNYLIAILQYFE